jgi:hypothetical protein
MKTIQLSQEQYIAQMLSKYRMANCSPVSMPMDPTIMLIKDMDPSTCEEIEFMPVMCQLLTSHQLVVGC